MQAESRYYFAYGSNLHPLRLTARIESARLVTTAALDGYRLTFDKLGQDGSSKCHLQQTGAITDRVYGAIYRIEIRHKMLLDEYEGLGAGYLDAPLMLESEGQLYDCFSYFAQPEYRTPTMQPYHWYRQLVVEGARYLQFPDAYISQITAVESIADSDRQRDTLHQRLLATMVAQREG